MVSDMSIMMHAVYGCGSNYFGQTGQPLPKENQSLSLVNGLECPVKQVSVQSNRLVSAARTYF